MMSVGEVYAEQAEQKYVAGGRPRTFHLCMTICGDNDFAKDE